MHNTFKILFANESNLNIVRKLMYDAKKYWGYSEPFLLSYMDKYGITAEYISKYIVKLAKLKHHFIGGYGITHLEKNNIFELDQLFISPNHIGCGYGKRLWSSICKDIINNGGSEFLICSDPNAASFYEKLGCKLIGSRKSLCDPSRMLPLYKFDDLQKNFK